MRVFKNLFPFYVNENAVYAGSGRKIFRVCPVSNEKEKIGCLKLNLIKDRLQKL